LDIKTFSLDFSFATFVRISVGPKCCNNLAALEQIILFLEMLKFINFKFLKKKKHFSKNTILRRKMKDLLEYSGILYLENGNFKIN